MSIDWQAFKRGEHAMVEAVYWEYVALVERVICHGARVGDVQLSRVTDRAEQTDLVQDVFLRAFSDKVRHNFDATREFRPFLLTIARRVLADHWRKRGVVLVFDENLDTELVPASAPDAEWRAYTEQTSSYLTSLDAESRRFVELRFEQSLSQRDVADAMHISRRHARTLEERIVTGLRQSLQRQALRETNTKKEAS